VAVAVIASGERGREWSERSLSLEVDGVTGSTAAATVGSGLYQAHGEAGITRVHVGRLAR